MLLFLKSRAVLFVLTLVFVLATVGSVLFAFFNYQNLQKDREGHLESFLAEQAKKRAELQRIYQQLTKEQAEELSKAHAQEQRLVEEVDKNFKPNLPDCSKLKGRISILILDAQCSYRVRAVGTSTMAVVLFEDPSNPYLTGVNLQGEFDLLKDPQAGNRSLQFLNPFLKKEAERYDIQDVNVELTFFGPYKLPSNLSVVGYYELLDTFKNEAIGFGVPEQDFDLVHYVLLAEFGGWGVAFPNSHRAITVTGTALHAVGDLDQPSGPDVGVFIHETLHLFGAGDKYLYGDCFTIGRADPFDQTGQIQELFDVMCNASVNGIINRVTAREIGWPN